MAARRPERERLVTQRATRKTEEAEELKAYVQMLPKVYLQRTKENYLESFDDADTRRIKLRLYFKTLRKRIARKNPHENKIEWIVASTPFPQLFEYKKGDEELFADCTVLKFKRFSTARKMYIDLLKFELARARSMTTVANWLNPRNEQP